MSDNTQLNAGSGGDLIRSIAKTANAPVKTQVMILDVGGGADGSPETPWTGAVSVSNFPASQPVSASTLPLPAGAATDAHLTNVQASPGTSATTATAVQGVSGGVPISVSGTFSASVAGFAPGSAYATPLSVSTTSSRVVLPTGTVVVVYNPGAVAAYVQLGSASVAATTSNDVVPAGGWMAFTVGANTYLAAITSSGTTTLNLSGGAGLPTGAGGGGGSSSVPTGSAGTPNASVLSVQGISGATALPVSMTSLPALATGANVIGAVTQSGAWSVSVTSEVGVGSTGSAVPTTAQYAGMSVGGNLTGMTGTANGLKVDGSAVTQPVSGTFWQATQPVSLSSLPALATGSNAIGSITNSSFGISGTLPAFAATPTVNLGTLNGAATDAHLTNVQSAPGTSATTAITVQGSASGAAVPISGSVTITSEPGAASTGAAVPSAAQYAGMNVGGNLTGLTGTANGLKVDGSAVTQPVSISGSSGTPTQAAVTVGTSSALLLAASAATSFIKIAVPTTAANGIWVRYDNGTAAQAAPSDYIAPGQSVVWIKTAGFLPTSQINAIASASVAVTVIYS